MPIIGQISVGDGATFTPAVDSDGVISWTNNKNLTNPSSVDIPQAVVDRYQLAPTANPTFTGTVTAEDITASGTITGDLTGTASGNLPLSGGTMTGNIPFNLADARIYNNNDSGIFRVFAGNGVSNGANLTLNGKSATAAGRFYLTAQDSSNSSALLGLPNGTLTWAGLDITPQKWITSNFTDKSVASGTRTNIGTYTITKGTWLVCVAVNFPSNATGYRDINVSSTSAGSQLDRFRYYRCAPVNGSDTHIAWTILDTAGANTTRYVNVIQTSGSALTVGGGVVLFRLSENV